MIWPDSLSTWNSSAERSDHQRGLEAIYEFESDKSAIKRDQTPHSYLCWSIFSSTCCHFFCLGWLALYYSFKSRSSRSNSQKAVLYSRKAKALNEFLLCFGFILVFISIMINSFKVSFESLYSTYIHYLHFNRFQ